MGAVNFSLDMGLAGALMRALPLEVFVETGTFKGDTVELVKTLFNEIHSIELSPELWAKAAKRFEGHHHVRVLHGDSPEKLREMHAELRDAGVLYWLDAHWCIAANTAGELSQCPLLEELKAIGKLNDKSVLLIDDARLFLAPPPAPHEISNWPRFDQITRTLRQMGPKHQLMIVNDVIMFYPAVANPAVTAYAVEHGVDWLQVMSKVRDYENLRNQFESVLTDLESKEHVLMEHHRRCEEKDLELREKQKVLLQLRLALAAYKIAFLPGRILDGIKIIFQPRLGALNQYPPREWRRPEPYQSRLPQEQLPTISLVTPSYEQGPFTSRTLDSVLDQDYPNLEYFVQDGGSTDETVEILKSYSHRLTDWESSKDGGQSQAINLGFSKTQGEIMAWLNSDDLLLPGALARVGEYFALHPEVDVVYGHRILIDAEDKEIGRWILPKHDDEVLKWADFIPQETLFWRRSIWEKAGGQIDETFRFAMDWDLLLRFRKAGALMVRLPHFLGAFRIHEAQKTSSVINDVGSQEMARLRQRELGRIVGQLEIRRALIPYLLTHIGCDLMFRAKKRLKVARV